MRIAIGLELNGEAQALAWALDFPGCFAGGADGPEAVIHLARQLAYYEEWINAHAGPGTLTLGDYDLRIVDTWQVYHINEAYEPVASGGTAIHAWFRDDWRPLDATEVENGLVLLGWSREDLLARVGSLSAPQLDRPSTAGQPSLRAILEHIAGCEAWYLSRLPGGAGEDPPPGPQQDTFQRLAAARARLLVELPGLLARQQVVGTQGEFWSPRKLLRRLLWHEIHHRQQIERRLAATT